MKNFFKEKNRVSLLNRLSNLTNEHTSRWGKMNSHQVIVHLTDPFRAALNERPVAVHRSAFSKWPFNKFVVYIMPWPKGAPTAPEFIQGVKGSTPVEFEKDKQELFRAMEKFVLSEKTMTFLPSPVFGKINNKDWGRLMWRHVNHHLKQFGV